MINEINSSLAVMLGYFHEPVSRANDAGKESPEFKNSRIQRILKEESKRVQPVYSAKGKLIEHDSSGIYLDVKR